MDSKSVTVITNGEPIPATVKVIKGIRRDPRYPWLPRFLMRWPRFRTETPVSSAYFQLDKPPEAGDNIVVMYEIGGE